MNSTELKDYYRQEVLDVSTPYFSSDEEVYSYLDDAQKMFCRMTGGIQDATSDITKIDVVAGEEFSDISPRLLKIRKATLRSSYNNVALLNAEDLWNSPVQDYGVTPAARLDNTPGPVSAIVLGMDEDKVRMVQIPLVNDTIDLVIFRLPLTDITTDGQTLEIPELHHLGLLYWMKYRLYNRQDAEVFDQARAMGFMESFVNYCAQARIEKETRMHKPRTIAYGGL